MKYSLLSKGFLMIVFMIAQHSLSAQDIHWSQFHNSKVYLNPALTAVFNGDTRFHGHYRSQWRKVPVNYQTLSGSVDTKFTTPKLKNSLFGFGLVINSDEAGDSALKNTNIGVSGAYTHQLAEKHFLTLGAQIAFANRRFDFTNLLFGAQYDDNIIRPDFSNREDMSNVSNSYGDFSAGLNYHFQNPASRSKLDLGVAMHHIAEPEQQFFASSVGAKLPRRINLYGIGVVGFGQRLDLLLMGTAQFQGKYSELVPALALRYHLDITKTKETAIQLGLAYRYSETNVDALAPTLELFFREWHIGLSYDINLSDFNFQYGLQGTRGFGGPELSVTYTITKVKMGEFRICPIY